MKLSDWWKEISATLAFVAVVAAGSTRLYADEEKLENHDKQLAVQTQILDELTKAALAKDAAERAKTQQCRNLIAQGKLKKGDCDEGEP